ncbi:MAG: DoxX family membrane protein [Bacteroidia bacterium]|nr:DoxX family membrane protein [Bacteroidia bacterium]
MEEYKIQVAELLLRCFTGFLFLFQGYDKLFRLKLNTVTDAFMNDAGRYHVPRPLVYLLSAYTSVAEFLGGLFLILGLFLTPALYALSVDLLLVGFAFSFIEPMWDLKYMFPRLILVVLLLILPLGNSPWSLDYLLFHKN